MVSCKLKTVVFDPHHRREFWLARFGDFAQKVGWLCSSAEAEEAAAVI